MAALSLKSYIIIIAEIKICFAFPRSLSHKSDDLFIQEGRVSLCVQTPPSVYLQGSKTFTSQCIN